MKTILICIAALLAATASAMDTCRVYFGTLAKQEPAGIYMAMLDTQTGQLSPAVQVSPVRCNGFITIHPDGKHLYSTGANIESNGIKTGSINAFRIVEPDGLLEFINTQPSGGSHACYVTADLSGKNLMVANYLGGSCAVLPILPDGALAPASSIQKHTGSGPNPKRQTAAFTHSINCDAANRFAVVTDLGSDQILTYRFDAGSGTISLADSLKTKPGGGPRHFTFHPNGKFAYADLELTSEAVAFAYDEGTGKLTEIQTISTLPVGVNEENTASEILTTPDGRFLYVGNRGHNSISIFSIDSETGKLTLLGHGPTRGETPHNFGIDPTGQFLIVANAKTGNAVVFRIADNGLLKFTGSEIQLPSPSCVRFLAAP